MATQHVSDAELAAQPVGYWTGLAYESIIAFIRARQAELGLTQPQFWLLRNLSKNDLSSDGEGMTIPELEQAMKSYLRREDDLEAEARALLERGCLTRDDEGRWWITESGEHARVDLKQRTPEIRARIHQGIDDAYYATTVKVLQQMIRNTGGPQA
jgi:hypothetical protein